MKFRLVDAHAHINSEFYPPHRRAGLLNDDVETDLGDWREVLARAAGAGIAVVNVGTNRRDSEENVKIAEEMREGVWATVGLHPTEKEDLPDGRQGFDYEFYRKMAEKKQVVAIGECGLDYNKFKNQKSIPTLEKGRNSDRSVGEIKIEEGEFLEEKRRQENIFREQIKLAREVGKPLMLHLRTEEAYADAIEILEEKRKLVLAVIFHFYSGTREQTERLLTWENFYVTVGGVITFSRDYDEVLKMIPIEKMMVETDSPFVAPEPYRGKRNEPAYMVETVKKLAEIKGVSEEEAARMTTEVARRIFDLGNKS